MSLQDDMERDYEEDFRAEERSRQRRIAELSCCDGMCGAEDCVRCRGDAALDVIFNTEQEEDDGN